MRKTTLLLGLAIAAVGSGQLAAAPPNKSAPSMVAAKGDAQAKAIVAACSDRRFETTAEVMDGGQKRVTRIKLCAKPGEDDATWLKSLKQAAVTIKGSSQLPAESRAKIVADLDAEIARVQAGPAAQPK